MRTKFLVFEYLLASFFALQVLFPHYLGGLVSCIVFVVLIALKCKYEGPRITLLIYLAAQSGFMMFSHPLANMTFTFLAYLALSYFPVYEFPEPKGPFMVGYRHLNLDKSLHASVFYPTLQKTEKVPYRTSDDGWVKIYDIMRCYPDHFVPKIIYKIVFDFIEYLDIGVNLNAKIIPPQHLSHREKFPAIVFSHGLSANRNLYTGFARQWASYGYVVFCIDHDEPIYLEIKSYEDLKLKRATHLEERCRSISRVVDFIHDSLEIKKFFQNSTIEIDYDRLSLAGHSFGSAAVAEASRLEQRITGALILLDPWLYPASDKALHTPAKRPVLVLRSEGFENVIEEFKVKQRIQTFVTSNKEYDDQTLSCFFKKSTHNSFCDLIVYMPREMNLFGIIGSTNDVEEIYNAQTMLSQVFLDLMLYSPIIPELDFKKALVLKAFDSYQLKIGRKSELVIDSF